MQLTNFRPGTIVRIMQLLPGSWGLRQRLLALGLIPGAVLKLITVAPLGDPVEILLDSGKICLGKDALQLLDVEPLSP